MASERCGAHRSEPVGPQEHPRLSGQVMRRSCLVVGAVLVATLAGGCASSREEAPSRTADRFETAVTDGDADAVCALLAAATVDELEQASGEPCRASVLEEVEPGGPRVGV